MNTEYLIQTKIADEMSSNNFHPNWMLTLLGHQYSSLEDVRDAFSHTINVLQRKIHGQYGKKIKHLSIAETGHQHFDVGKGAHIHSLILLDDCVEIEKWKSTIKTIWSNTRIGTSIALPDDTSLANETWFQPIVDTKEDMNRAIGYCLKNSSDAERSDFIDLSY